MHSQLILMRYQHFYIYNIYIPAVYIEKKNSKNCRKLCEHNVKTNKKKIIKNCTRIKVK